MTGVRVRVDRSLCDGNGVCVSLAPEVFELDEDDLVRLRRQPGDAEAEAARRAVAACPKAALAIEG